MSAVGWGAIERGFVGSRLRGFSASCLLLPSGASVRAAARGGPRAPPREGRWSLPQPVSPAGTQMAGPADTRGVSSARAALLPLSGRPQAESLAPGEGALVGQLPSCTGQAASMDEECVWSPARRRWESGRQILGVFRRREARPGSPQLSSEAPYLQGSGRPDGARLGEGSPRLLPRP